MFRLEKRESLFAKQITDISVQCGQTQTHVTRRCIQLIDVYSNICEYSQFNDSTQTSENFDDRSRLDFYSDRIRWGHVIWQTFDCVVGALVSLRCCFLVKQINCCTMRDSDCLELSSAA